MDKPTPNVLLMLDEVDKLPRVDMRGFVPKPLVPRSVDKTVQHYFGFRRHGVRPADAWRLACEHADYYRKDTP